MATPQISGTAVAVATAGAVLIYAGFRGQSPLQSLREIASGRLTALPVGSAGLDDQLSAAIATGSSAGIVSSGVFGVGASAAAAAQIGLIVSAAQRNSGDRYSIAKRWQPGYSDCSSFVGKALRAAGIEPPGASVTGSYLAWSKARKVARADVRAGDIIVNATHVILATSNTDGIGQQNSRDNVKTGKIENLMWGTGSFVCLRITG